MPIRVQELRQMNRTLGNRGTRAHLIEAIREGHLSYNDFSIRDLAEGLVDNGREWVQSMNPRHASAMESMDAVDSTAFSNITGQLLFSAIMDSYNSPAYNISSMFPTLSTSFLDGERIAGIGRIGDKAEVVHEGMPFPHVGLGEDYVDTPATEKHGLIVPVTKEAVFADRTGLLLDRAREVGEAIRIRKEKRCIDVLIGKSNTYKWKGTPYNTYQAAAPWANLLSGAAFDLTDWASVDIAEQLFAEILDPNTGEPIAIMPNSIIVSPARKHTANRIINATEVRSTSVGGVETLTTNPLSGYTSTTSQWLYSRLMSQLGLTADQAKATWFFGDIAKAFRYMEAWPLDLQQQDKTSEASFNQDIVAKFKASERGIPVVWNPRYVVKVSGY